MFAVVLARSLIEENTKQKTLRITTKFPEAATGGVLLEKVFLKFFQNSQKKTSASLLFLKKTLAQVAWGLQL